MANPASQLEANYSAALLDILLFSDAMFFVVSESTSSGEEGAAPSEDGGTVATSQASGCTLQLGKGELLVAECSTDLEAAIHILSMAQSLVKARRVREEIKEPTICTCCLEEDLQNAMVHFGRMTVERYQTIFTELAHVGVLKPKNFWVEVDMDLKLY